MATVDEDIDNETLQAQIDLSLSFAQNLVSSWVKPSPKSTKSSSNVREADLKEYMRRPPRLGVGAAIPEVTSASRVTEQLRSRLSGKNKRVRGEDDEVGSKQAPDLDEEGSRGESSKKKVRIDPFDTSKTKKKGMQAHRILAPRPSSPPPDRKTAVEETSSAEFLPADAPLENAGLPSPTSRRKKHKNKDPRSAADSEANVNPAPQVSHAPDQNRVTGENAFEQQAMSDDLPVGTLAPPSPTLPSPKPNKKKKKRKNLDPLGSEGDSESSPALSKIPSSNIAYDGPTSAPKSSATSPAQANATSLICTPLSPTSPTARNQNAVFTGPILNLTGPPATEDASDEEGEPQLSPKKKRRRKKKKKSAAPGVQPQLN
ncbi:hypothetical protein GGX14DRAFT_613015 [Mycena pura]|uniref:Uncharacterized protein n=1 Tax=Mycena pura TaxID=153505 RepID=A0AAD7E581_9AGAR|nr:hypothetical protein GGX14DRAFT_613015 [Mycena pura]